MSAPHAVLQAFTSQTNGAHAVAAGVLQLPVPSQYATDLPTPPEQLAARQVVDEPGRTAHSMRSLPSQLAWQAPEPGQVARAPWGAPKTGVQLPTLPGMSHASHCPLHAALQHTLSTQMPEPQSPAVAHDAPLGLLHAPVALALHARPVAQLAVLQQALSTQWPPPHCASRVQ